MPIDDDDLATLRGASPRVRALLASALLLVSLLLAARTGLIERLPGARVSASGASLVAAVTFTCQVRVAQVNAGLGAYEGTLCVRVDEGGPAHLRLDVHYCAGLADGTVWVGVDESGAGDATWAFRAAACTLPIIGTVTAVGANPRGVAYQGSAVFTILA